MTITVQQVIDLLLVAHPGEPIANTVDTLKCGDPQAPVTGIATCFLGTQAVAAQAVAAGCNLLISHEPIFYNHRDAREGLAQDPVFQAKQAFLAATRLAVFRYHDYWHRIQPDGILTGMLAKLGWTAHANTPGGHALTLPPQPLRAIAAHCKQRLGIPTLRLIGDLDQVISHVSLHPGYGSVGNLPPQFHTAGTELLIVGESPEWETAEYVRDANTQGRKLALIVLGHCDSEEAGMEFLIAWLRPRLVENFGPEAAALKLTHIPSRNPFTWL